MKLKIDPARFTTRDLIYTERLQQGEQASFEKSVQMLSRFCVNGNDEFMPEDEAYELLLDLRQPEIIELMSNFGEAMEAYQAEAVNPTKSGS